MNNDIQKLVTGPASGFTDLVGDTAENKALMLNEIIRVFKSYGFIRLDTPVIEKLSTLRGKGGTESEKLIYKVLDSTGEDDLGLRFDLTVPLARFCAQNEGKVMYPFKRYATGEVYRGETSSLKKGRYRGFTQCDIDIVGSNDISTEITLMLIMIRVMNGFGLDFVIRINNRLILDAICIYLGIPQEKKYKYLGIIDEIEKITSEKLSEKLELDFGTEIKDKTLKILDIKGDSASALNSLKEILGDIEEFNQGFDNLINILSSLKIVGLDQKVKFDISIVRGLDYYTGLIFEASLLEYGEVGSVMAGGRYDRLIETLGGPSIPAVGTSFGVDRILTALNESGYFNSANQESVKIYVGLMGNMEYFQNALQIAESLRSAGFVVLMPDSLDTKLKKQFADSSKSMCKYTLVIGENEFNTKTVTVKDMSTGEQNLIPQTEIIKAVSKS